MSQSSVVTSLDIHERECVFHWYVLGQCNGSLSVHGDVRVREPRSEYPLHDPLQFDT